MLTISLAFAAGCGLINLWLAMRCGRARATAKVSHGDGGDPMLIRRMRAHANFAEFTPIVLILFVLVEWTFGSAAWLWLVAGAYLAGRIAHGIGMDADSDSKGRIAGILVTMLVTLGLAGAALWSSWQLLQHPALPADVGTPA